ncbi:uncharacterized protein LOC119667440, partial [Teleopsis dalmanni]|uniref:uncharacterized protein LOC119667440 n=1 Tax=Teleopsis dalmanni TaxID=139649 RepID=UPI0018CF4FC5
MEIPENLQKIKIEHPSSPEKSPQNNIKERLHLHVKRRLNANTEEIGLDTNTNKQNEKQKEPKTKRPYQKRSEKVNTKTSTDEEGRKNKRHKSKNSAIVSEETANVGAGGIYDDDEINDADSKTTGRDKDKYPDVLNMVLSVKKRALMQNTEVKEFFIKLMNEIK